jgi:hypothetical protein
MRLTARQLNRATLDRQLLLRRERLAAPEAVRRVTALQAQEPASPYLALWNRLEAFDPAKLDGAYASGEVVKATLLRGTLHAVHASDYPAYHAAMAPTLRQMRLGDARFTRAGLSIPEADALLPEVLAFHAEPRTRVEAEAWLDDRLPDGAAGPVFWAMRTYAPFHHAPVGGPWSHQPKAAFRTGPETLPPDEHDGAAARLARRYLEGFGPASAADLARFTMLRQPVAREAIAALGEAVVVIEGPGGSRMVDLAGATVPDDDTPAPPRLLPMWDSTLLAYVDRGRLVPAAYRREVTRTNGDVLPTLLVDGLVAGVWRPVEGGIEATAFHALTDEAWAGLATEASSLVAFLADRDPAVYRRYGRWWAKLPEGEVRVLPG